MVDLHFCLGRKINTLPRYWHLFLSGVMAYILRLASLTSKEFTFLLLLDKVAYITVQVVTCESIKFVFKMLNKCHMLQSLVNMTFNLWGLAL